MPDTKASVKQLFGFDSNMEVPAYSKTSEHVPDLDPDYLFNRETTLAILAGFAFNRRVMVTGYHGTGKSTHIEQVAARLNWPCIRINLDSHISRIDLIGKDAIKLRDGVQVTEFHEGILPWALVDVTTTGLGTSFATGDAAAATATTVAAFILASVATCFSAVVARGHVAIGGTGILRLIHAARLALVATPAATSTATILLTIGFTFGWCRRGDST